MNSNQHSTPLREVLALNVVEVAVFHRGEDGMKRYVYLDTAELYDLVEQFETQRAAVTAALGIIAAWENDETPDMDRFFECDADFLEAVQFILRNSNPAKRPSDG